MKKQTVSKILISIAAIVIIAVIVFAFFSNSKTATQQGQNTTPTETADQIHYDGYKLDGVVILSRHNIRSPLSDPNSVLGKITPHKWFEWSAPAAELSQRGALLETSFGQFFYKYLLNEGLITENWQPTEKEARFYSNSMQRTIATARYFLSGMLPMSQMNVEYHQKLGEMDPVFNPSITFMNDAYFKTAMDEINKIGGENGINGVYDTLSSEIEITEKVLDFNDSEYTKEKDMSKFAKDDIKVTLEVGKEPAIKGVFSDLSSAADALQLQYFESPNATEAAFNHSINNDDWKKIAKLVDVKQNIMFSTYPMAVNVARPMLEELKTDILSDRKFTYLCGHDSNIESVLASLKVQPYELSDSLSQLVPIGSKLLIEKWSKDGKTYVSVDLVYQGTDQLRNVQVTNIGYPPLRCPLSFEGKEKTKDGLYLMDDFLNSFDNALADYEKFSNLSAAGNAA